MKTMSKMQQLGECLWILTADQPILGIAKVPTHMAFVKLSSGRFIALSTVPLDDKAKKEINSLTNDGELLDAVIGTNPFHGLNFPSFHAFKPQAKYYGTPRHIRNIKEIPWAGSVADVAVRDSWKPDVDLQITAGTLFDDPPQPTWNHFAGVVAFHAESKTVIADDCFAVENHPGLLKKIVGLKHGDISFHPSLFSAALRPDAAAVQEFHDWMVTIMEEWDFENIATAHGGILLGNSKVSMNKALIRIRPKLKAMAEKRGGKLVIH
ncbi:hypothetical protein BC830DRAFT_1134869 [Chytriomyces sp. MP71]|nr:hypothetical protein BC830DRAFT_1134869 [Chytriomyces sp. MP71]